VVSGGTPNRSKAEFFGGNIPWIKSGELNQGQILFAEESISELGLSESAARIIPSGSTLVAMYGATAGVVGCLQIDAAINQAIAALIPGEDLDPEFLFHSSTLAALRLLRETQGSGQPNLNAGMIKRISQAIPPLSEQRKIAEILSSVDEAIQATQAVIEQTRRVKEGLLQELLTKGIGHTRFKKTAIGEIPESWEVCRLDSIASIKRGRFSHRPRNAPHLYGGAHPFVQTGDVAGTDDMLLAHTQTLSDEGAAQSRTFPKGTILITIAANIGDVVLTTYDVACPDSLVGIIPHEADPLWLLYALAARKDELEQQAPESAQKNINLQVLNPLLIALPSKNEQIAIRKAIQATADAIHENEASLASRREVKKGLLQDLLTGKVRVAV
jgi:type I restriction enzyme S subunit